MVPARVAWAVELLDIGPDDRVLELGGGPGVAAGLVCDRLVGGSMLAIDRSPTAVERTTARNAAHIAAGRLRVERCSLDDLRTGERFDKAFAVNVNLFWTSTAEAECAVLRSVLADAGGLWLVYDGPGEGGRDVGPAVAATLERGGFTAAVRRHPEGAMTCVAARPAVR